MIPAIWGTTIFHKGQNGETLHDQHEGFDGQPSSEQHIHGSEAPQKDLLASAETVPFVTRTVRSHSGSFLAAEPSGKNLSIIFSNMELPWSELIFDQGRGIGPNGR